MTSALLERVKGLRGGELGPLPVIAGLVVIATLFQTLNDRFLSPQNLFNLSLQIGSTGVIALGLVFVLMIGEIDLSAGAVSGVTAAGMVVLNIRYGWDPALAIVVAILAGAVIGLLHGLIFTRVGVPSFVLTLGGLLAWQGVQLWILGTSGAINVPYEGLIASFANTALAAWWGYVIAALYVVASAAWIRGGAARRRSAGLPPRSTTGAWVRTAVGGAVVVIVTVVFQQWKGIPLSLMIFCGLVLAAELVLRYTVLGRRLAAVGGNMEAARRAGIRVNLVKTVAFSVCSAFAAFGGLLAVSRLFAVNQNTGGNDVLLNAVAAAVIGGTSLFGGRGTAYSALLGMLVIGAVANGMDLLNQSAAAKFVITGVVLVAAVVIDALGASPAEGDRPMSMEAFLRQGFLPFEQAIERVPHELAIAIDRLRGTLAAGTTIPRRPAFVAIGASLAAMAPAVQVLERHGVAARRVNAAELEWGSPPDLADLVVAVSQSGRSRETAAALERMTGPTVALVNVTDSPIATRADKVISLGDVPDSLASTIGYCATVAAGAMLAETWVLGSPQEDWSTLGQRLAEFLDAIRPVVPHIAGLVGDATAVDVVAPFDQVGIAEAGTLLLREVARIPAAAFELRQYLHGPMEASGPGMVHVIVDGPDSGHLLPRLEHAGLAVVLLGVAGRETPRVAEPGVVVALPAAAPAELPIFAAVALQHVVAHVAATKGIDPDRFLYLDTDIKIGDERDAIDSGSEGWKGV